MARRRMYGSATSCGCELGVRGCVRVRRGREGCHRGGGGGRSGRRADKRRRGRGGGGRRPRGSEAQGTAWGGEAAARGVCRGRWCGGVLRRAFMSMAVCTLVGTPAASTAAWSWIAFMTVASILGHDGRVRHHVSLRPASGRESGAPR